MIGKKMEAAFNDQIREEVFSAYLYWSMAAYFESISLGGFAAWMKAQAQEEMMHATKFFDHISERGGRVILQTIKQPESAWDSPLAAFEAAYRHEQHITGCIDGLVKVASDENDNAAGLMLQWFVAEQVEEEKNADDIVNKLKLVGDHGHAILMMDRELGQRVFTPPAASAEADA